MPRLGELWLNLRPHEEQTLSNFWQRGPDATAAIGRKPWKDARNWSSDGILVLHNTAQNAARDLSATLGRPITIPTTHFTWARDRWLLLSVSGHYLYFTYSGNRLLWFWDNRGRVVSGRDNATWPVSIMNDACERVATSEIYNLGYEDDCYLNAMLATWRRNLAGHSDVHIEYGRAVSICGVIVGTQIQQRDAVHELCQLLLRYPELPGRGTMLETACQGLQHAAATVTRRLPYLQLSSSERCEVWVDAANNELCLLLTGRDGSDLAPAIIQRYAELVTLLFPVELQPIQWYPSGVCWGIPDALYHHLREPAVPHPLSRFVQAAVASYRKPIGPALARRTRLIT